MKKHLFIIAFFFGLGGMNTFAQDVIPNGSFESWANNLPDGWLSPFSMGGFQNVFQSGDAQSGSSSVELKVVYNEISQSYLPSEIVSDLFAMSSRPEALNGYYKGSAAGSDSLYLLISLVKNGSPVGFGFFTSHESVTSWTSFSATIIYLSEETPDEATITIIVGDENTSSSGSDYFIDNLFFGAPGGIESILIVPEYSLFPNPTTDLLNVRFTLAESDNLSFKLITAQGTVIPFSGKLAFPSGTSSFQLSTASLAPGMYIMKAEGEKYQLIEKITIQR
jgi:hypothetical protein